MKFIRWILMIFLIVGMMGCQQDSDEPASMNNETMEGIILEVFDSSFIMLSVNDYQEYVVDCSNKKSVEVNQMVKVVYNGEVRESYPMQITADEIYATSTKITMFLNALAELYERDTALNEGVSMLSVHAEESLGIEEEELSLIAHIQGIRYGASEVLTDSYSELVDKGYWDDASKCFSKGIYLELNGNYEEGSFHFETIKYKGSLSAYYLECKAIYTGNSWSYTVEAEAIS